MKNLFIAGIFIILLALLAAALTPIPPPAVNDLQSVSIEAGQEVFAWHYNTGFFYEQKNNLDKAAAAYQEAMKAEQPEIIAAAMNSLGRVIARQGHWLYPWQQGIYRTLRTAAQVAFFLLSALAIGGLLWLLAQWGVSRIPSQDGFIFLPFEDFTEKHLAKNAHRLLYAILQQTEQTHREADKLLAAKLEANAFPPFGVLQQADALDSNVLKVVEKIKLVGLDVNLASLFKWGRGLLRQRKYAVSAQLYQSDAKLQLLAKITETKNNKIKAFWRIEGNSGDPLATQLHTVVEAFAYQFLTENPASAPDTRLWQSLRLFTDGLYARQRYVQTTEAAYLNKAVELLEQAVEISPDYDAAQYALGGLYHTQGHYQWAEAKFRQIRQNRPDLYLEASYNLGVCLYHQIHARAKKQAMECFEEIIAKIGEERATPRQRFLLALTYARISMLHALEIGRPEKEWVGSDEQKKISREQLTETRAQKSLSLAEGLADKQQRNVVIAIAQHARGISLLHQADTLKNDPQREKLLADARALLQESIDLRPDYPLAYIALAQTFPENSDEQLQRLEQAVKILPGFEYGQLKLGIAYRARGEWDAAIAALKQAPGLSDARNNLGEIFIKQGHYQAAMEQFQQAVKLNKRHYFAWHNMAWRTLQALEEGTIPYSEALVDNAAAWSRRALDTAKPNRLWHANDVLGWAYLHQKNYPKSEAALRQALKTAPKKQNAQVRYHLAQLYVAQGNTDKAARELQQIDEHQLGGSLRQKLIALQKQLHQNTKK